MITDNRYDLTDSITVSKINRNEHSSVTGLRIETKETALLPKRMIELTKRKPGLSTSVSFNLEIQETFNGKPHAEISMYIDYHAGNRNDARGKRNQFIWQGKEQLLKPSVQTYKALMNETEHIVNVGFSGPFEKIRDNKDNVLIERVKRLAITPILNHITDTGKVYMQDNHEISISVNNHSERHKVLVIDYGSIVTKKAPFVRTLYVHQCKLSDSADQHISFNLHEHNSTQKQFGQHNQVIISAPLPLKGRQAKGEKRIGEKVTKLSSEDLVSSIIFVNQWLNSSNKVTDLDAEQLQAIIKVMNQSADSYS